LRRYAKAQQGREERGPAYFVLGYREYEAGAYSVAAKDLGHAAETQFLLADSAEYFGAASAYKAGDRNQAIQALDGFSSRHPDSPWRLDALNLLARSLLETGKAEQAIQALTAEPRVRQRPNLTVLLAQAFREGQRNKEAATTYQEIYYAHPTAPEADRAAEALRPLEALLGSNFPRVTEQIQTARADALFKSSRFVDAFKEYSRLLESRPGSPLAGRWKLGQVRCWLGLKEVDKAVEGLQAPFPSDPTSDAERMGMIVEVDAQQQDEAAMLRALEELAARYPQSLSYASALFSVGNFFAGQEDWETAALYYKPLADNFPQDGRAADAHWRVAWAYYLQRENVSARQGFIDHLHNYPSSPHGPAALYWLGRLEEQSGDGLEARAPYDLLAKRFTQSYYAFLANRRMAALPSESPVVNGESPPGLAVSELAKGIRPREPMPDAFCGPSDPNGPLLAFSVLRALNLAGLAEQYLKAAISDRHAAPDFVLALIRLAAAARNTSAALYDVRKLVPVYFEYPFSELPKEIWDLLYPRTFWRLVERQARANRLDPYLVMAIIRQESGFNPRATSRANARGLMQILPLTASPGRRRRPAVTRKLFDPSYNVAFGCRYFRRVLTSFGGRPEPALAAYNAGDLRVRTWLDNHKFDEPAEFVETIPSGVTRVYVKDVLRDAVIYRRLLTGSPNFKKCGSQPTVDSRRLKVKG
jgi:soluble lytic murein transglycosylase